MTDPTRLLSPLGVDMDLSKVSLAALGVPDLAPEAMAAAGRLRAFFESSMEMLSADAGLPEEIPFETRSALEETIAAIEPPEYSYSATDRALLEDLSRLMVAVEEHQGLLPEAEADSLVMALERFSMVGGSSHER